MGLVLPLAVQAAGPAKAAPDVVIAILDTGIDPDHAEFTACDEHPLLAYKDLTPGQNQTPQDGIGHGTAVASVAVGATLGQAPCTPFLAGQVCSQAGCYASDIEAGIRWAIDQDADIINLSLGTAVPTPELLFDVEQALAEARDAGVLVTVSAGNGVGGFGLAPYPSSIGQPSGSHLAFVIGSADEDGDPAFTHNWDPEATQAGVDVRVALAHTGDGYTHMSGTSLAAPNAAGIAAVVLQAHLDTHGEAPTPDRLEEILTWTAADDPWIPPTLEGWGFLDKDAAVHAVETGQAEVPPCQTLSPGTLAWSSACLNQAHDGSSNTLREQW